MSNILIDKKAFFKLSLIVLLPIVSMQGFGQPPIPTHGAGEDFDTGACVAFDIQVQGSTLQVGDHFSAIVTAINSSGETVHSFSAEMAFFLFNDDETTPIFPGSNHEFESGVMTVNDLNWDAPGEYSLLATTICGELEGQSEIFFITPRVLHLFDFYAEDKIYDGSVDVLEYAFADDRLPDHELIFSYEVSFADPSAGDNKEVIFSDFAITGGQDADKYYLSTTENQYTFADIQPKTLSVGGSFLVEDKEYDGTTEANIIENHLVLFHVLPGDDVVLHPVAEFESAEEGTHSVFLVHESVLLGHDSHNYILSLDDAPQATAEIYEEFVFFQNGPWNNPNNWKGNATPQAESKVSVAAQASTRALPVKGNGRVNVNSGGGVHVENNLTFANNGRMEIAPRGSMSVDGHITGAINKGEPVFLISSDASGSGSIIHKTPGVSARIERYLPGNADDWHMISTPVAGQLFDGSKGTDFSEGALFAWHEGLQTWVSHGSPLWDDIHENRPDFIPGKGYMASYDLTKQNEPLLSFEGEMQTGIIEMNITSIAHSEDAYRGFNLLGNPYPSAIDWKATSGWLGRDNLQETDSHQGGYNMWIWNPEVGQYGVQNTASVSDYVHNGISRFIQPMQAFWVRASEDITEAVIEINNDARVHTDYESLKNIPSVLPGAIKLIVSGELSTYSDEAIVEFGHQSDKGGAPKMFSIIPEAPSVYTSKFEKAYSINFLDTPENWQLIPVGFEAGFEGVYTLNILGADQWSFDAILIDTFLNKYLPLEENSSYDFYAQTGDDPDRFILVFTSNTTSINSEPGQDQASVFLYERMLTVNNPWQTAAIVSVFTSCGQLAESFIAHANTSVQHAFRHRPGIYIINVSNSQKTHSERVVLGK